MTVILGIESTAHTFGIGIIHENNGRIEFLANERSVFKPEKGFGIEPSLCAKHHQEVADAVLEKALYKAGISLDKVNAIAYSCGPGLPPCLLAGLEFAKSLSRQLHLGLLPVNHCIAHIEIAKFFGQLRDPVVLYVSGGNTQVIGYADQRYRVFGETMDIGVGNALDVFAREIGFEFPGGPVVEDLWKRGKERNNYIDLPYVVKGMDLSFTGIVSDAVRRYKKSDRSKEFIEDLAFSFSETVFAMLTEVTERALSHTRKNELILTGGVGASVRLQDMLSIMCRDRNVSFFACPKEYANDNGAMIAYNGMLLYPIDKGLSVDKADFNSTWRTDDIDVIWMR